MASYPNRPPLVVGLYGLPGSGKSFILRQLKDLLSDKQFTFYEGSEMLAAFLPGGLSVFKGLDQAAQFHCRQKAIEEIGRDCARSGRIGVVAGHLSFQEKEDGKTTTVYTPRDLDTYSHILYLDVPPDTLRQRRAQDNERQRPHISTRAVSAWQMSEQDELRQLCRAHAIEFIMIPRQSPPLHYVLDTLVRIRQDQQHPERQNERRVKLLLDKDIFGFYDMNKISTVLVIDADKTLCDADTGSLFWDQVEKSPSSAADMKKALAQVFSNGYTYGAFAEAASMYQNQMAREQFETACAKVASSLTMHPEFVSLLRLSADKPHIGALVVTCGLRHVWEMVMKRYGLSSNVRVIGGGRSDDNLIITPETKATIVRQLRIIYGKRVCAFGDSPIDIPMLRESDHAFVAVGREETRSKSMEKALLAEINRGLRISQILLPPSVKPRIDCDRLPVVDLGAQDTVKFLLSPHPECSDNMPRASEWFGSQIVPAAVPAASLLMTPMRDARIGGHRLREVHHRVGWYLAVQHVVSLVGLEEAPVPHVQGYKTDGFRLLHETDTMIVAIMRAGEPMAFGVSEAFPLASFLHADRPEELEPVQLRGLRTILLVDSVINSGKTIAQFVRQIRGVNDSLRIVVVAGVISEGGIQEALGPLVEQDPCLHFVSLRVSSNRYKGRGGTDTGNRLFITTNKE